MARGREAGARFRRQALQERQGESCGLARAGLRGAEKVAAGEDHGNGLLLDGRGRGVAFVGYRL
jgi:hypothetical protein